MIIKFITRIIVFSLFMYLAFPLVVLIAFSFTDTNYLAFPPKGLTFRWYLSILEDSSYTDSFQFSILLALVSTLISVAIGIPASQVLARYQFKGKSFVNHLIASPLLLPQIVFGVALLQFFYYFVDKPQSFWTLTIGHVVLTLPYIIKTCSATFAGLPSSLEEAAADLGANKWETFFLVTFPLIKPGVIAGGLFAFAISWINVEVSIFLTASNQMALPVKMFNYVQYNIDPTIAAVSAVTIYIAFLLIILIDHLIGIEKIARN
jgi:putative spermidine/putrescine transport system permease protein